jgi:thiol-disulfide isomerase/thioredoxin
MKPFLAFIFCLFLTIFSANAENKKLYPTLTGKTTDGKNFDLKEQRGKIIVVNFWASWCVDCRKELPVLDEIYEAYKERGVEIIGVSTDHKRSYSKVLEITKKIKYPNLLSGELTENSFPEIEFLPTAYLLDKNGKLIAEIGSNDNLAAKKIFEDALNSALKAL